MDAAAAWSTQQLAEFLALVSSFDSNSAAALGAVERAAEALDAEVAAIVSNGTVIASVGFREGSAPADELESVAFGPGRQLMVPGVGLCPVSAVALEFPPNAALVLARTTGLNREELSVLQGMARAASMTMRTLHLLSEERAARDLADRLAEEQAALRRVATLVARAAPPDEVFAAVIEEVGRLLDVDFSVMGRYEAGGKVTFVAGRTRSGVHLPVATGWSLGGKNATTLVSETGRTARIDHPVEFSDPAADVEWTGIRSSIGAPIMVGGRLWGVMVVATKDVRPLPRDTEARLAAFTDLLATAIANAEARAQLTASRMRIVAAADQTRRRIERDLHDGIQQRLVTLALALRGAIGSVPGELPGLAAELTDAERGLQELLEEVREISRGLHPAILSEAGLGPALKSLARRSTVPVELDVRVEGRLPASIEAAAYYLISEALTNTAKHAAASVAKVAVDQHDGLLRIQISDDGVGGADPKLGTGLLGLTDRVEALGGRIAISSPSSAGTTMVAELPT